MHFWPIALCMMLTSRAQLQPQAEPVVIKCATTWEELLQQPAIDLGDGVKIRLAIESLACPQWSGVALYAYTEGFDDIAPRQSNRDALGPVWVSVRFGDTSFDRKSTYGLRARYPFPGRDGLSGPAVSIGSLREQ
jgi:hypothetical protein